MTGFKLVFGRDGTPITDIKASVVTSSLINDLGEAIFYVSTDSIKAREEVLKWGNYIHIQRTGGLDDWCGMLDTPRPWHNGYLEVHAFDFPFLLQYRPAPLNETLSGTPGEKFIKLLAMANAQEDTLIRPGNVFMGGVSSDEIINDSIYSHLKKIRENNGHDWMCTPTIDANGKLTIIMDWLERAGLQTDLELSQGFNILSGDTPLEEDGEIINSVEAVSSLDAGALTFTYTDETHWKKYGLRRVRHVFSGINDASALEQAAKQFVNDHIEADIATPLTAINVGSTFSNIRRGNIAAYRYSDVGFAPEGLGQSRSVRIEGYRHNESDDTCELYTGKVI